MDNSLTIHAGYDKIIRDLIIEHVPISLDPIIFLVKVKKNTITLRFFLVNDSRIRQVDNVLYIDNINLDDGKKYSCLAIVNNTTVTQVITLKVRDRGAALGLRGHVGTVCALLMLTLAKCDLLF